MKKKNNKNCHVEFLSGANLILENFKVIQKQIEIPCQARNDKSFCHAELVSASNLVFNFILRNFKVAKSLINQATTKNQIGVGQFIEPDIKINEIASSMVCNDKTRDVIPRSETTKQSKFIKVSFFLLLVLFNFTYILFSSEYPMFRGNYSRNGNVKEYYYPAITLSPKWSFDFSGECISQPVFYKGKIYQATRTGEIGVFDAQNGEVLWNDFIDAEIYATPVISSGVLCVPSKNGYLYAYILKNTEKSVSNGETANWNWRFMTDGSDCSSPLVIGNKLYSARAYPYKDFYCLDLSLDPKDFEWQYDTGQYIHSSPSYDGNYFYTGSNDGKYYKFQDKQPYKIYEINTTGNISFSVLALDNNLGYGIPGSYNKSVYIYDLNTGNQIWKSDELDNDPIFTSSVSVDKDNFYLIFSSDTDSNNMSNILEQHIICFNKNTRIECWRRKLGNIPAINQNFLSSPVSANNVIIAVSGNGMLYCLDKDSGTEIGKFQLDGDVVSSPVIAEGNLFVSTMKGKFYCFAAEKYISIVEPISEYIAKNEIISISGLIKDNDFNQYSLYWSTAENTYNRVLISSGGIIPGNNIYGNFDVTNLPDGRYYLKLIENNDEIKSGFSSLIVDNLPFSPTITAVTDYPNDQGDKLIINWDKSMDDGGNNNDVTGYKLYKSTISNLFSDNFISILKNTTFYIDSELIPETTYYYKIKAYDMNSESNSSNEKSGMTEDNLPPLPPAGLLVKGFDTKIELCWIANKEADKSGYKLYKSSNNEIQPVYITTVYTTYYIDLALINLITYYYQLTCFDIHNNESNKTDILNLYPSDVIPPAIITDLTVRTGDTHQSIILDWINTGDDGIEKDIINGGFIVAYSSRTQDIASMTKIEISTNILQGGKSFSYKLKNLLPATTYYIKVSLFDEYKNIGNYSAFVSTVSSKDMLPPAPPDTFIVEDYPEDFGNKLVLHWKLSADDGEGENDVTNYLLKYSSGPDLSFTDVKLSARTTYFDLYNLFSDVTYYFELVSQDITNFSSVVLSSGYPVTNWKPVKKDENNIISDNGVIIEIDKNSLSKDDSVVITIVDTKKYTENGFEDKDKPVGKVFNLKFYNIDTVLLKPAKVSLSVSGNSITINAPEYTNIKKLRMYYYDTNKNIWRINNSSLLSDDEKYVSAKVSKLSMLRIMELIPSGEVLSIDKIYTYPNPAKGDKLYFKFYLNYDSDIKISIYNIAGELIKNLTKEKCPAGIVSETEWDISKIASGIYMYKLEAKTEKGIKSIIKKLAIVK